MRFDPWRMVFCTSILLTAYQLSRWQVLRNVYANWDKPVHAVTFFLVWWVLRWTLTWPAWVIAVLALVGGAGVEIHQIFLPGFTPSVADWLADAVGVLLAYGTHVIWQSRQRQAMLRPSRLAAKDQ